MRVTMNPQHPDPSGSRAVAVAPVGARAAPLRRGAGSWDDEGNSAARAPAENGTSAATAPPETIGSTHIPLMMALVFLLMGLWRVATVIGTRALLSPGTKSVQDLYADVMVCAEADNGQYLETLAAGNETLQVRAGMACLCWVAGTARRGAREHRARKCASARDWV